MLANNNSANVAAAIAMAAATGSNPLQHASPQLQLPAASPAPAHQLPPHAVLTSPKRLVQVNIKLMKSLMYMGNKAAKHSAEILHIALITH